MRLLFAVGWRRGHAVAQCVGQDDEILVRIDQLSGSDKRHKIFRGTAKPGGKQHGIGFFGVEFSERPIADAAVVDDFAAFQAEITEVGEL